MENGPWRQHMRGLTRDPVSPRWMGGLWKTKAIGLVGQENASHPETLFLLHSLSYALEWRSFLWFKPPKTIFPSVQVGEERMRLFYSKVNAGVFDCALFWEVEGWWQRQNDTATSARFPQCRAAGAVLGKIPVFSVKPGTWGVVIKGANSSLLQPDFQRDPIRSLTRNPEEPSDVLVTSPHYLGFLHVRRRETIIVTSLCYTVKSQARFWVNELRTAPKRVCGT